MMNTVPYGKKINKHPEFPFEAKYMYITSNYIYATYYQNHGVATSKLLRLAFSLV